jgi:hypothetical protein
MYRIHFDHRTGMFVIQVLYWGLFWTTVRSADNEGLSFKTFSEATKHVTAVGLDQLYQNKSINTRQIQHTWIN